MTWRSLGWVTDLLTRAGKKTVSDSSGSCSVDGRSDQPIWLNVPSSYAYGWMENLWRILPKTLERAPPLYTGGSVDGRAKEQSRADLGVADLGWRHVRRTLQYLALQERCIQCHLRISFTFLSLNVARRLYGDASTKVEHFPYSRWANYMHALIV